MNSDKKNYLKIVLIFVSCLLVRLIPFRAPNIEPIFASLMPVTRASGAFVGFLFAVLSILTYDLLTGTIGMQTFFTAGTYGIIGFWAANYFKKQKVNKWSYARFAIMGTLFFDAVTGLTVGPIFFKQSFISTFIGQIPFTAFHLLGNITLALILSPAIYHFMIKKKETIPIINPLNPKVI